MPLGINVFGVNGLVTVIDVCAMVLDGNAVICVRPKASTKSTEEKKEEEKKKIVLKNFVIFRVRFHVFLLLLLFVVFVIVFDG